MKTRRKQALAMEKRERMRKGGGSCMPDDIDGALEATNIELQYVFDRDVGELFRAEHLTAKYGVAMAIKPCFGEDPYPAVEIFWLRR